MTVMRCSTVRGARARGLLGTLLTATVAAGAAASAGRPAAAASGPETRTPIRHVIVVIGENRTYDNVFATWSPPHGHARTLLSQGIVTAGGECGDHAGLARQQQAVDSGAYRLDPTRTGAYAVLPQPDTTTAKGLPPNVPDTRFPANLPNCPYRITKYVPYSAYTGDPIHRFYQMWQQSDGERNDLNVWTAQTAGFDNGAVPPKPIHQGALQMGYYSMAAGDAPVLRFLADHYASSDNYHQAVMGGTGANHVALGTGDAAAYLDAGGRPTRPPQNQIENPDAKPGTNNNFTQDGYSGGTFSNCSDRHQPGVGPIRSLLDRHHVFRDGDCAPDTYYLLNNYDPGYLADGTPAPLGPTHFTVPPQRFPTVGDALSAKGISWGYYGVGWNGGHPTAEYCGICNPMQYATSIMTDPTKRANLHGYDDFTAAVSAGSLPAVSFVKPGDNDGHPASSTLPLFEDFTRDVVKRVMAQPQLFASTAILVTFDEGGGFYDSGYVQPLTFFGDGPRIPMLVVSPYAREGEVDHTYTDHVSVLKFIERNWGLRPLSERSTDNLPDPQGGDDAYVPGNSPAIGDLMGLFDFSHRRTTPTLP
ncbi:MAG TPA: alkaline phosphatase family protein [Candidatus Dormibacteraeota bacterium]|nr:alkaline phosphatase family protein [Candidatus Dormibacteraeota bacterium]